jgi:Sensors of blue-light using FAD
VTGMLLYKDGNFMQFLEGEKENVISVHARISKDPRHTGFTLLQQEESAREFTDWAMGFKKLGLEPVPKVPGYSDFINLPLTSEQFLKNPITKPSAAPEFQEHHEV